MIEYSQSALSDYPHRFLESSGYGLLAGPLERTTASPSSPSNDSETPRFASMADDQKRSKALTLGLRQLWQLQRLKPRAWGGNNGSSGMMCFVFNSCQTAWDICISAGLIGLVDLDTISVRGMCWCILTICEPGCVVFFRWPANLADVRCIQGSESHVGSQLLASFPLWSRAGPDNLGAPCLELGPMLRCHLPHGALTVGRKSHSSGAAGPRAEPQDPTYIQPPLDKRWPAW